MGKDNGGGKVKEKTDGTKREENGDVRVRIVVSIVKNPFSLNFDERL